MNFLDRNTLPKFQERLDLAASDLNEMEEIYCKAINELAGRIYNISNLVDKEERKNFAEETSYIIIEKFNILNNQILELQSSFEELKNLYDEKIETLNNKYTELDERLNTLDDAAARKEDLNAILYRTGQE